MSNALRGFTGRILTAGTALLLAFPVRAAAEDHVVPPGDLHRAILNASEARQQNIDRVRDFISSEDGKRVLEAAGLESERVKSAVPLLGDEELARLAERTGMLQGDFAAGALNNQEITYILIALSTAVLILIIVAAR